MAGNLMRFREEDFALLKRGVEWMGAETEQPERAALSHFGIMVSLRDKLSISIMPGLNGVPGAAGTVAAIISSASDLWTDAPAGFRDQVGTSAEEDAWLIRAVAELGFTTANRWNHSSCGLSIRVAMRVSATVQRMLEHNRAGCLEHGKLFQVQGGRMIPVGNVFCTCGWRVAANWPEGWRG